MHSRSFIVGSQCSHISTVKTPDCNLGMVNTAKFPLPNFIRNMIIYILQNDSILEEKKEDDTEVLSVFSESVGPIMLIFYCLESKRKK